MRIKKDVDPKGTQHRTTMMSGNTGTLAVYRVAHVAGLGGHIPGEDPEIYLELAGKTAHPVQQFVNLPLSVFVENFRPKTEDDVFWTDEAVRL